MATKQKRIKCTVRPEMFGCSDTQLTPGKFYNLISINFINDGVYYTVIGNDGMEVQRRADYFMFPAKGKKKLIKLVCGKCAHTVKPKKENKNGIFQKDKTPSHQNKGDTF